MEKLFFQNFELAKLLCCVNKSVDTSHSILPITILEPIAAPFLC